NAASKNFAAASGSRTEIAMWRSLLAMGRLLSVADHPFDRRRGGGSIARLEDGAAPAYRRRLVAREWQH
ncbi:MAG TPA: hypothetical protein VLX44_00800, partial [Xanthobacteraceae bacterium]|nr:hypothetical protein [Xanthobacteraceae bacterium]